MSNPDDDMISLSSFLFPTHPTGLYPSIFCTIFSLKFGFAICRFRRECYRLQTFSLLKTLKKTACSNIEGCARILKLQRPITSEVMARLHNWREPDGNVRRDEGGCAREKLRGRCGSPKQSGHSTFLKPLCLGEIFESRRGISHGVQVD